MSTDVSGVNAVTYPWDDYPAPGTVREVAEGLLWLSTPVPFVGLRQVNLWLLRDGDGWTMIDCGYGWDETRGLLETVWKEALGGLPVKRLIVTHYHPDHSGLMAWISERWGNLLPNLTLGEWFAANVSMNFGYADNIKQRAVWHRLHGLDAARQKLFEEEVVPYDAGVSLPPQFKRLRENDVVTIGRDRWRVIVGQGHAPEHVSLYCAERKILIAGDQILPQITTNVSTWPMEPEADTLMSFLETCQKFLGILHPETLVLPSHRKPFRNVLFRLRELGHHHALRLNQILDAPGKELTAGDLLDVLFRGKLDGHQIGFAMGEAIAHLNYLVQIGRLQRLDTKDGTWRYGRVDGHAGPVASPLK